MVGSDSGVPPPLGMRLAVSLDGADFFAGLAGFQALVAAALLRNFAKQLALMNFWFLGNPFLWPSAVSHLETQERVQERVEVPHLAWEPVVIDGDGLDILPARRKNRRTKAAKQELHVVDPA